VTTAELFACFGDIIELDFPSWDLIKTQKLLDDHSGWKQYNPRKINKRFGLSVTSLDGGYSGVPDLDSLLEFNRINNTSYKETDFKIKTDIVSTIPELDILLNNFMPDLGRCHFLKLDAGGFFPPHRDNGTGIPSPSFRVIVPLANARKHLWHWIHENRVVDLNPGRTYCINTTKEHSVFSFVDNCCMLVLNVLATPRTLNAVTHHLQVR